MELYPFKFHPIYKEKIWGGFKIKTILEKDFGEIPNCGESWEVSGVSGDVSIVSNGHLAGQSLENLIKTYKGQLLGQPVFDRFGNDFPLLIKFIDANDDLSVQVHPDDHLAQKRHNSMGKTEMWYVIQADEDAELISGFNRQLNKEAYMDLFNHGRLEEILNREKVYADDVFFLPAGRVHTIGKGILLAEIQQTSDITYRIYDFDRPDLNGNLRELHVEEALDALDFTLQENYKTNYARSFNQTVQIEECPYFSTSVLTYDHSKNIHLDGSSFTIFICIEGHTLLKYHGNETIELRKGETILVPANIQSLEMIPETKCKILETHVPVLTV